MKRMALVARVTVWTALLAAALAGRSALAVSPPGCTDALFAPPPMSPHFTIPNAGAWTGYRGAAIEHDWTDARRRLTGSRPMSFRPLRSLLTWLESLLMPRSHQSAVCLHCQATPIDFELGYDPLPMAPMPADEPYYQEDRAPPAPVPKPPAPQVTSPAPMPTPAPSPLFNPLPDELTPLSPPAATSPPVAIDPPVEPTPAAPPLEPRPPANVVPKTEPTPAETKPAELKPSDGPIVELAPEVTLPMDPPVRTLPPRNTIPKPSAKPPKNLVPRYGK